MTLSTYLYFNGNCGEAFDFYLKVFDGVEICRETYAGAPDGVFENDDPDRIMHATIQIGSSSLMGADRPGSHDDRVQFGNGCSIHFRPESKEHAGVVFQRLSEGGSVTMPLQETFWGSWFGMCTDRFGVHWKVNWAAQP